MPFNRTPYREVEYSADRSHVCLHRGVVKGRHFLYAFRTFRAGLICGARWTGAECAPAGEL